MLLVNFTQCFSCSVKEKFVGPVDSRCYLSYVTSNTFLVSVELSLHTLLQYHSSIRYAPLLNVAWEIYFTSLITYLMSVYHSKMCTQIKFYIGSPGGQHGFIWIS